jgi:hypothetical protein
MLLFIASDPLARLGTISVEDIKSQDFFQGIYWDDIYNRTTCGPWVPDPVFFSSSKKPQSVNHNNYKTINDNNVNDITDNNKIDEFDNFNRKPSNDNCDLNCELDNKKPTPVCIDKKDITRKKNVSKSDKKSNNKNQSKSELLEMRESIFIGTEKSKIQDWSFVDESVLVTVQKEPPPFKDSRSNSDSDIDINAVETTEKQKTQSETLLIDM